MSSTSSLSDEETYPEKSTVPHDYQRRRDDPPFPRMRKPRPRSFRSEPASEQDKYSAQTQSGLVATRDLLLDENARLEELLHLAQAEVTAKRGSSFTVFPEQPRRLSEYPTRHEVYPAKTIKGSSTVSAPRPIRMRVHKNTFLPRPYAPPKSLFSIDDAESTLPTLPQLEAKLAQFFEAEKERLTVKLRKLEDRVHMEGLYLPEEVNRMDIVPTTSSPNSNPSSLTDPVQSKREAAALHQIILHLSSESHIAKLALHRDREELKDVCIRHMEVLKRDLAAEEAVARAEEAVLDRAEGETDAESMLVDELVTGGMSMADDARTDHEGGRTENAKHSNGRRSKRSVNVELAAEKPMEQEMAKALGDLRGYVDVLLKYWPENNDLPPPGIYQNPTYPTLNAPPIPATQIFPRKPETILLAAREMLMKPPSTRKSKGAKQREVSTPAAEQEESPSAYEEGSATQRPREPGGPPQPMPENLRRAVRAAKRTVEREGLEPGMDFNLTVNEDGSVDVAPNDSMGKSDDSDEPDELEQAFRKRLLKRKMAKAILAQETIQFAEAGTYRNHSLEVAVSPSHRNMPVTVAVQDLHPDDLRAAVARSKEFAAMTGGIVGRASVPFDPTTVSGNDLQATIMLHQLYEGAEAYRNRPRHRANSPVPQVPFNPDDINTYKAFQEEDTVWSRKIPYQIQFDQREGQAAKEALVAEAEGNEDQDQYLPEIDLGASNAMMAATLSGAIGAGQRDAASDQSADKSTMEPALPSPVEPEPCTNCGRTQTTVWRIITVDDVKYKVCNPCGLHYTKNDVMRPPSYWTATAPRSRRHAHPKQPKIKSGRRGRPKGSANRPKAPQGTTRAKRTVAGAPPTVEAEKPIQDEEEETHDSIAGSPEEDADEEPYEIDNSVLQTSNQEELDGFMRQLYSNVQAGDGGPFAAGFDSVDASVSALLQQQTMESQA